DLDARTDDELRVQPREHHASGPRARPWRPWPPSPPPRLHRWRRLDLRRRLSLHVVLAVGSCEDPPRLALAARLRLLASAPEPTTERKAFLPHWRPPRRP